MSDDGQHHSFDMMPESGSTVFTHAATGRGLDILLLQRGRLYFRRRNQVALSLSGVYYGLETDQEGIPSANSAKQ